MSAPAFLIVWDLDHTLGVFDSLEDMRLDAPEATVWLRPGIAAALERLSAEGFDHRVLTLATPAYAEMALRGAGLRDHFSAVESVDHRPKGDAHGIAREVGIPIADCPRRMLFVGDHPLFDAPRDPAVVFHFEPRALVRPAAQAAELALRLRTLGDGSLRAGFDELAARATKATNDEQLERIAVAGLGELALARRAATCPVVTFADEPVEAEQPGDEVTFSPRSLDLTAVF